MTTFYYAEDNQRHGPFTIDELELKPLKKSTLVWREGMANWTKAESVVELQELLSKIPPPLPGPEAEKTSPQKQPARTKEAEPKYDF